MSVGDIRFSLSLSLFKSASPIDVEYTLCGMSEATRQLAALKVFWVLGAERDHYHDVHMFSQSLFLDIYQVQLDGPLYMPRLNLPSRSIPWVGIDCSYHLDFQEEFQYWERENLPCPSMILHTLLDMMMERFGEDSIFHADVGMMGPYSSTISHSSPAFSLCLLL